MEPEAPSPNPEPGVTVPFRPPMSGEMKLIHSFISVA